MVTHVPKRSQVGRIVKDLPFGDEIAQSISEAVGHRFEIEKVSQCAGGSINAAYCVEAGHERFFVKVNHQSNLSMFVSEAKGLRELAKAQAIRAPEPLTWGQGDSGCWLIMEYIDFGGSSSASEEKLGQQLAQLHRYQSDQFSDQFGWIHNNTIGSTPQINTPNHHWIDFYSEQRLGRQLDLAKQRGSSRTLQEKGECLRSHLPAFFADYTPIPSLLHGDLWQGNKACDSGGNPVIFDPAIYYGDRETDLAMTTLFGGFSQHFYRAYHEAWRLDDGYEVRKDLYNLYHILNHANLFGGGYAMQAESMIDQLLVII
ncbi:MAG: fructosamine kinase family protein [Mariprofundaceae bacterium]